MLFDEKDLNALENEDARDYFKEVLQSYYGQNYRAAIVTLYSFVIYDLFIKLQTMANEGDKKAEAKVKEINSMISDDEKYSKIENEIIQFYKENCALYFNKFDEDIDYLKNCRNKCAHLKVNDNSLYRPNDYHVRMLIFFVPAGARWSDVSAKAHDPEIGQVIDDAMRAIEKENARLKDILSKNFARPELDKRRLGEVVDLFTNIKMIEHGSEKDILGRTYEYCLSMFAEQEGKRGGEFFTPACVVRTLVEVLQPFKGRVYDPCCGSGGMFVQSAKFVENHSGNINDISIYGQDSNPTTWKLAQMNLAIRGIEPDLGKYAADTFLDDQHPTMRADYIMANPPFNLSNWGAEQLKDDVRWQYGMPPASNANFAWLQHMIYHLAPGGRMGMVLANGSLSSQSGGEGDIRKNIVNADLVDCIIAMPTQLFYTTQIPVSLWFISKRKKQAGKTLFIDVRKMGVMVSRKLRELADEDIKKIADTYNAYVNGTLKDVKGFCTVVDTEKIAEQDYILTPGRYVGVEEQEDDGEPFEEKMARLTSELSDLFKQSHKLEAEIKEKLGAIGYEI